MEKIEHHGHRVHSCPAVLLAILVVEKMSSSVKNVLVLDNDNMSGCYDDVLHYLFFVIRCAQSFRVSEEEIIGEAAVLAMQAFVFRPGIMFFLRDVARLKEEGRIDKVVMYTNAYMMAGHEWRSSTWGLVTWAGFIAKVLGHLAGDMDLFDVVLTRREEDRGIEYPQKNFARIVSSLGANGFHPDGKMCFLDDRPTEIEGSNARMTVIGVEPYTLKAPLDVILSLCCRLEAMCVHLLGPVYIPERIYQDYKRKSASIKTLVPSHLEGIDSGLPLVDELFPAESVGFPLSFPLSATLSASLNRSISSPVACFPSMFSHSPINRSISI